MEISVRYSRNFAESLSLETLPYVSAYSSTSLILAINSINIIASISTSMLDTVWSPPRLGDCKHVEVVGGNGVLYLNKVFSILKRAYTEVCDLNLVRVPKIAE